MNEINEQLKGISELVTRIDAKILDINTKLDELIKALHEYDDDYSNETYGESSFEAFQDEATLNKRMDIIGQNGNEGTHYVSNEEADEDAATFSDYGMRIAKKIMSDKDNVRVGKDKSNNSDKYTVVEKKRNNGRESGLKAMSEGQPKQKRYWKNNRSKRNDNKK